MPGEALARLHGLAGSERASKQTDLMRLLHQSTPPIRAGTLLPDDPTMYRLALPVRKTDVANQVDLIGYVPIFRLHQSTPPIRAGLDAFLDDLSGGRQCLRASGSQNRKYRCHDEKCRHIAHEVAVIHGIDKRLNHHDPAMNYAGPHGEPNQTQVSQWIACRQD